MKQIFLGPPVYWLIWFAVIGLLYLFGSNGMHVRSFVPFMFSVLGVAAVAVLAIVLSYRHGQRITREPFEDE